MSTDVDVSGESMPFNVTFLITQTSVAIPKATSVLHDSASFRGLIVTWRLASLPGLVGSRVVPSRPCDFCDPSFAVNPSRAL